jgi:hypothetical protein
VGREDLWDVLVDREKLWDVLVDREELWDVLADREELWDVLVDRQELWDVLVGREDLWDVLVDREKLWDVLVDREELWDVLVDREEVWDVLVDREELWDVLVGREELWDVLVGREELWDVLVDREELGPMFLEGNPFFYTTIQCPPTLVCQRSCDGRLKRTCDTNAFSHGRSMPPPPNTHSAHSPRTSYSQGRRFRTRPRQLRTTIILVEVTVIALPNHAQRHYGVLGSGGIGRTFLTSPLGGEW